MGKIVTEVWAWVCIDKDGDEAIPAVLLGTTWYPAIGADKARIESLRPWIMSEIAPRTQVKLVKFSNKTVIEVIWS